MCSLHKAIQLTTVVTTTITTTTIIITIYHTSLYLSVSPVSYTFNSRFMSYDAMWQARH
jgi:hypothetical protein